jgi:hypothetical protein
LNLRPLRPELHASGFRNVGQAEHNAHGRAWMHRDLALLYFAAVRPTKALAVLSEASLHSFGGPTGQLWLVLRVPGTVLVSSGL